MGKTIEEITATLGNVYFERQKYDKEQKSLRTEFFEAASATFTEKDLARKTVEVPEDQVSDPEGYALRYNPGWKVVSSEDNTVTIEEDPGYKSFVKIFGGFVVTRSIVSGQALVDDDRLQSIDPELWEEVTEWENSNLLFSSALSDIFDPEANLDEKLREAGWPRVIKDPDDLTATQIEKLKAYLYEGPKTIKLLVRRAKEDETEE